MMSAVDPDAVLVSVVMAVYNGEEYLNPQIQSILEQSHRNTELIITDDASSDNSLRIAKDWARKDPRVKVYVNSKNIGLVKNFLGALRYAKGEFVCFSDQDDVWREDKIAMLALLLLKSPSNMLVYSDLEICDERLRTTHKSFWKEARIKPRDGTLRELSLLRNIIPGCSMMFRREVRDLLIAVPAESSLMHDHLAFIFASSVGRILCAKEPLIKYRQHSQNTIGAFHPSVWDRKLFQERLKREINILRPLVSFGLGELEAFLDGKSQKNILSRWMFVRYSLFLRPDTLISKLLGVFECFSPRLYRRFRDTTRFVLNGD